jgi:ABC-type transport system involved in cytochrome c biogenesis ATPase subunit
MIDAHVAGGGLVVAATHQPLSLSTRRVAALALG